MPYKLIRKNQRCWMVVNSETGKVHSKCTSQKKAKSQIRLLESLTEGEGFTDIARAVVDKLLPQRQAGKLSPKSRTLLQSISNETITSLECVRTPIESYIDNVLNAISFGKWKQAVKQSGYDRLFHLSLFINKTYVFHKIEVLTLIADKSIIKSNSEVKNVPLGSTPITIGQLIQKTKDFMGDQKFTSYDPVSNNCQDLVLSVLKANNLNTPELEQFVKQDAVKIFEKNPSWVGKFAQTVTDVAGRVNRLVEGEGGQKGGFAINLPPTTKKYIREMKTGGAVRRKSRPQGGLLAPRLAQGLSWIQALKKWNGNKGTWCIPKKGTIEYNEVKKLMKPEEEKKSPEVYIPPSYDDDDEPPRPVKRQTEARPRTPRANPEIAPRTPRTEVRPRPLMSPLPVPVRYYPKGPARIDGWSII